MVLGVRSLRLDDDRFVALLDLELPPAPRDLERAARELERKTPSPSGRDDRLSSSINLRLRPPDERSR